MMSVNNFVLKVVTYIDVAVYCDDIYNKTANYYSPSIQQLSVKIHIEKYHTTLNNKEYEGLDQ